MLWMNLEGCWLCFQEAINLWDSYTPITLSFASFNTELVYYKSVRYKVVLGMNRTC